MVLSYAFWTDHYGRDPAILGKQIKVSGVQVTIIGVTRAAFRGPWPGSDVRLYLPLQLEDILEHQDLNDPNSVVGVSAIGRLRPGVSIQQADAELALFQKDLLQRFIPVRFQHSPFLQKFFKKSHLQVDSARSGLPTYVGRIYTRPLYLMQGLVGIVLLLCCVNIGGLMMSKVYARQHEFAVRTALGARLWRLVRQYCYANAVCCMEYQSPSTCRPFCFFTGSAKSLASFARPSVLVLSSVRSIDWTPSVSVVWLSMNNTPRSPA